MKTSKIEWVWRIGVFGTFLGHGVLAVGVKESWIPLITAFGFNQDFARTVLPIIGTLDITVAVLALFWPIRIVLIWAAFWAFATALARPIAGEPIWDFIERFANWSVPLALLLIKGLPKNWKDLFNY